MMDPEHISRGADPIPCTSCVDAKRLRCSETQADQISKVLEDDNTSSWLAPVPPLDDENLLQEILIRLPTLPSSLPRASLVCTRWRNILSNPEFLKRYRKHHRKPPLLGFFAGIPSMKHDFVPFLDTKPDHIPTERFALRSFDWDWHFMGCRHGLAVLINQSKCEAVVWDPLSGQRHRITFPPDCQSKVRHAVVMCTNAEDGHVHGDCFLNPFKLVLIWVVQHKEVFACLYESVSGIWGDAVSMASTDMLYHTGPSILVGNALCCLLRKGNILAFDFDRQSFAVIKKPVDVHITNYRCVQLLRTKDGVLGFAVLSELTIRLWERKSNSDGVVGCVLLQNIIQLEGLLPFRMQDDDKRVLIMGYDEDTNVIVLSTAIGNFTLQLDSVQIKHIIKRDTICYNTFYPYRSFYTTARCVGGRGGGAENFST